MQVFRDRKQCRRSRGGICEIWRRRIRNNLVRLDKSDVYCIRQMHNEIKETVLRYLKLDINISRIAEFSENRRIVKNLLK